MRLRTTRTRPVNTTTMSSTTKEEIQKAYERGQQDGGKKSALKIVTALLALCTLWCSSGLIAFDLATILPSKLTPILEMLRPHFQLILMGMLLGCAPMSHLAGTATINTYRLWQPLKGGRSFVYAQTAGWTLYGGVFVVAAIDFTNRILVILNLSTLPVCFTCHPGFLVGVACMLIAANALILSSLHMFREEQQQQDEEEQTTSKLTTGVMAQNVFAAFGIAEMTFLALIVRHPAIKPFLVETELFQAEGVKLLFCEVPYQYSSYIAQLPSAILHLPVVPLALLYVYRGKLSVHEKRLLYVQTTFQIWTAIGHCVPNPRVILTQEASITLVFLLINEFIRCTTKGFAIKTPLYQMFGYMLACYFTFGLLPAILSTAVIMGGALLYSKSDVCNDLTPASKKYLFIFAAVMMIMLGFEVNACSKLLTIAKISWHSPFDLVFWQGFWSFVDYIALTKSKTWRK